MPMIQHQFDISIQVGKLLSELLRRFEIMFDDHGQKFELVCVGINPEITRLNESLTVGGIIHVGSDAFVHACEKYGAWVFIFCSVVMDDVRKFMQAEIDVVITRFKAFCKIFP